MGAMGTALLATPCLPRHIHASEAFLASGTGTGNVFSARALGGVTLLPPRGSRFFLNRRLSGSNLPQRSFPMTSAALDPSAAMEVARHTVTFCHNALYSIADSATDAAIQVVTSSASDAATSALDAASSVTEAASTFVKQEDWLSGLADGLEGILKLLETNLAAVNVPYAYGFSIILLTILVKAATYPLTKQQVESTMAMQNLQPKIKAIQSKYAGDQERIQLETARLYQQAGVNPLAGCLPTLATIPVWIGLYRALSNVAKEGILTEGFFWIPSLAGPGSSDSGLSWLFPFVDGVPPLGWVNTAAYLVLPILLVASQFFSMQLMQPPTTDPAQKQTQAILKFLPLMIGYFSLSVPSGLSLYWLTNNLLSTAQQVYLKQMGGAVPIVDKDGSGIIDAGQAKRSGAATVATEEEKERERARGERFKALKAAEVAKKTSARQAAEEAAKASSEKTEQSRERLVAQRENEEHGDDEEEEDDDEELEVPSTGPAKVSAGNGIPKPVGKRSKRSKRTKKVA